MILVDDADGVEDVLRLQRAEVLFLCSHAQVLTEDMLGHVLGVPGSAGMWTWLSSLGVVQREVNGLRLNALMRWLVDMNVTYRSPDRCAELHLAVHAYAKRRLAHEMGHAPVMRPRCHLPARPLFAGHVNSQLPRVWQSTEALSVWPRGGARR